MSASKFKRYSALAESLASMLSNGYSAADIEISELLLFGLDYGLVSAEQVHGELERHGLLESVVAIRFAPRLLTHEYDALWSALWRLLGPIQREWLILAAYDTLGAIASSYLNKRPAPWSDSLDRVIQFAAEWAGGKSVDPVEAANAVKIETKLRSPRSALARHSSLAIVGFSGSGKSSLIGELPQTSKTPMVDVDELSSNTMGEALGNMFSRRGAVAARIHIYHALIENLTAIPETAILLIGSSTTCIPDARRVITDTGWTVVHALAGAEATASRLKVAGDHPLSNYYRDRYSAVQMARIRVLRGDQYYAADLSVDTSKLKLANLVRIISAGDR